jgi:fucose 4-O-acetylase-like acetyltransferase
MLPFLGSLAVMQVAAMAVRKNILNFFVYLGKESLPIYLAHVLVASGIRIVLFKILKIHNPIIHVLLGTIAGIIVPLILYSFVMKRRYLSMLFSYPKKHKLLKNNVPS